MTDAKSCNCACHSADPDSPGCPECVKRHDIEPGAVERMAPIDELRAMPRPQKLILAGKADRATRVLLMRDVDPDIKHLQAMAKSWSVKPQIKQAALKLVLERGR